jgi:lysophospholipase L1-like esterase
MPNVVAVGLLLLSSVAPHWIGTQVDLSDWSRKGDVAINGTQTAHLGPGKASLTQRFPVGGLHVVYFGAQAKSSAPVPKVQVRLECLDAKGRELMSLTALTDPKKNPSEAGIYLKTQAFTASIVVSIEKLDSAGEADVSEVKLEDDDRERKSFRPMMSLDDYMTPIWIGNVVHNETVLMQADDAGRITGHLLFKPEKILSVRDYGLDQSFQSGVDYSVSGKTITELPGSKMPYVKSDFFEKGDLKWFTLLGHHVVVTYEHRDSYNGLVPAAGGARLPKTVARLQEKRPLSIVAYGDSITLGNGTSAFTQIPPYMPTWAELAVYKLKKLYSDSSIKLYNAALGGMTSDWGADNAEKTVAALKPDLVLIAFGMNDFWWMPSDRFQSNVKAIMASVLARNPKTEFILIAPMRFNPLYTTDPQYVDRLASYSPALKALQREGVEVLDMTAVTRSLFAAKPANDCYADPLHPNDFLARWYAQGVVRCLRP